MALWAAKSIAVSFGGVFDSYDAEEDDLTSVFYNELYGYQITNGPNGRWISLNLKKPKQKKKGPNKAKLKKIQQRQREEEERRRKQEEEGEQEVDEDGEHRDADELDEENGEADRTNGHASSSDEDSDEEEDDPDDPQKTVPIARYNAMMAVQKNTLYIYGGIVESQEREYTLDDFYTLQLDKLDRFTCLKECNIAELEWKESEDEDDEDDESGSDSEDGSSSEDDEGEEQPPEEEAASVEEEKTPEEALIIDARLAELDAAALRAQATAFLGVAKNTERTAEDMMSTPLPGETLKTFYDRTSEFQSAP